jgi:serine/threonine protein kinase
MEFRAADWYGVFSDQSLSSGEINTIGIDDELRQTAGKRKRYPDTTYPRPSGRSEKPLTDAQAPRAFSNNAGVAKSRDDSRTNSASSYAQANRPVSSDRISTLPAHAPTAENDHAHAAWRSQFGTRHLVLNREDQEPFTSGRRLGGGGVGIVHETELNGIPLALKRTYTRRLTDSQLNEIKILGRISEKRHHHVVELVGSYIHRQRNGSYELGLLIWPVAHCDLAAFLHDLDTMEEWSLHETSESQETIASTLETLSHLLHLDLEPTSEKFVERVYVAATSRLKRCYGCIAEAIAYLHDHDIRHKDLKPSQILLSPEGLWLTDFGWSNDMSEYSQSATSGGDNITAKYQAPERASKQPCGRAEDVFALGCCFVEMSVYTELEHDISRWPSRPWKQTGWSFQAKLAEVRHFLHNCAPRPEPEKTFGVNIFRRRALFPRLILDMLALEPQARPTIDDILRRLSQSPFDTSGGQPGVNSYFGHCCQRPILVSTGD